MSDKHLHARALGEALVVAISHPLIPCQCSHRSLG